jgi:hypothetical protein
MKRFLGLLPVAATAVISFYLLTAAPSFADLGDVVRSFKAIHDDVWQGAVCWRDGYIWECGRKDWELRKRDAVTGKEVDSIDMPSPEVAGLTWDSKRKTWWLTEPWDQYCSQDVLEIPAGGGDPIGGFEPSSYGGDSGIFYDAALDRLWITNNHAGKEYVGRFKADGTRDWKVTLSERERVCAVARAGNDLWIGDMVGPDGGEYGVIYKYTLDGEETGVSFQLPGERIPQSLSFDGKYLWAYGCGYSLGIDNFIYQIDIGGALPARTPTPGPGPEPTPEPGEGRDIIDYNGDGMSDFAVFRPDQGFWAIADFTRIYFGRNTDIPVPADYTGDGKAEIAVFRPQYGLWRSYPRGQIYFGRAGDHPVPADYNGDGKADVAIFRDDEGLWSVRGITRFHFGRKGDMPIYADFNLDGKAEFGIYRPSTGLWAIKDFTTVYLGEVGDFPVPGDYLGKGVQQIAIFRPSTGLWASSSGGRLYFAKGADYPQPGDYNGDGRHSITGFWNSQGGDWAIFMHGGFTFGEAGDIPVSARIYRTY